MKIVALIVVPFIVMIVVMYFTYPYLNEEKYQQAILTVQELAEEEQGETAVFDRDLAFMSSQQNALIEERLELQAVIDSLMLEREQIAREIEELTKTRELAKTDEGNATGPAADNESGIADADRPRVIDEAEFSENIKSLLNLDEEELAPIVSKLSNDHLIRLYKSAGNIQREKLLRSLTAERAAVLMERIML